jgi:hypothetical protein
MRRRRAKLFVLCLLLAACGARAVAQDHVPKPYTPDEFAPWLRDLWRAEAIFVGSLPISLFATLETYDSWRYFTNGLDPKYAPWPMGSSIATSYSAEETAWLAVSAVSLSLIISGIDFLLGRLNESATHH